MPRSASPSTTVRPGAVLSPPAPRAAARKLSRAHRPDDMSIEAWQAALRRQFGREQGFRLRNTGTDPVFSTFEVSNPATAGAYHVTIRGTGPAGNHCSCPDFTTNTLGTCKHVEFTLARLERRPAARAALARGFRPPYSEVVLHYGAAREVRFHQGTTCPPALARLAGRYFDGGALRPEAFARFETMLAAAHRFRHEVRCGDDVREFVAQARDAERRRARVAGAFPAGIRSSALTDLLAVPLYPYQREAALFAARAGRCLIADEMGLGKTLEALAAAELLARLFGIERVLIVCPTSLKHQWEREIARLTQRTCQVVGGPRAARAAQFAAGGFYLIAGYDTVHRDLDLIREWGPDLVVLDEAQRIKNWATRTARSVKKIASPYAIVLTGTPIENRLEELISIVQFVDQHRLGPTFRLLHDHQIMDGSGRVVGYRNLDRLAPTLAPILLRRRKGDVLAQLPERIEKRLFVPMTPEQMQHHEENREIVARIVAKWRRARYLSEADQRGLTIALQRMRMACDSTYLLDAGSDHGHKVTELVTLLEEILERPQAKAVVFSQWLRMHELIARRLRARGLGHGLFHGGLEARARQALVDRFREDPACRVLLATDAGGVGLNLQHASVVVNVDLPWNPAVLEQRVGRVHRLGQTRPVQVVNLVAEGTIEEGMLGLLGFKKSLFAGVLDGGEKEVFLGGSRLARFMESVETATGPVAGPAEVATDVSRELRRASRPGGNGHPAERAAAPAPATLADPGALGSLLRDGAALLQRIADGFERLPAAGAASGQEAPPRLIEQTRDARTGEPVLQIRLPEPAALERIGHALRALLGA